MDYHYVERSLGIFFGDQKDTMLAGNGSFYPDVIRKRERSDSTILVILKL